MTAVNSVSHASSTEKEFVVSPSSFNWKQEILDIIEIVKKIFAKIFASLSSTLSSIGTAIRNCFSKQNQSPPSSTPVSFPTPSAPPFVAEAPEFLRPSPNALTSSIEGSAPLPSETAADAAIFYPPLNSSEAPSAGPSGYAKPETWSGEELGEIFRRSVLPVMQNIVTGALALTHSIIALVRASVSRVLGH